MTRIDQGNWQQVHFDIYARSDPYQETVISLTGAYERISVQVIYLLAPRTWIRAGQMLQFWGDRYTGTLVSRHYLPLQEAVYCRLEPVQNSKLVFRIVPWINEFGITIQADLSSINPG